MDPKELRPGMLPPNMSGGKLIGGVQQLQIMVSHLCVNCFPKPVPAVFLYSGYSLCEKCFVPRRKYVDAAGPGEYVIGIDKRDYEKTWGKKPTDEGEINAE